eukprot:1140501-Heterocapsa_arctica.AAC.1
MCQPYGRRVELPGISGGRPGEPHPGEAVFPPRVVMAVAEPHATMHGRLRADVPVVPRDGS